jgi:hypothetical protein
MSGWMSIRDMRDSRRVGGGTNIRRGGAAAGCMTRRGDGFFVKEGELQDIVWGMGGEKNKKEERNKETKTKKKN